MLVNLKHLVCHKRVILSNLIALRIRIGLFACWSNLAT
ncbi:hypothetical protein GM3709_3813 (plasmid) [Geminocystis sp. NIES-3709]|nr:hypothetical protein GM3709_3813 [Geminocystis sp. NIES-3709]